MTSQPRSTETASRRLRIVPLGLKIGVITILLLGFASVIVANEMAELELASLVDAKRAAAQQVTDLFATYDAAALEFADATAIEQDARGLAESRDFVGVAVFDVDEALLASVGSPLRAREFPGADDRTETVGELMRVVRRIRGADGTVLGVVAATVSLSRENAAYRAARVRIVQAVLAGACLLALALALALWRLVTVPLATLVSATQRLEQGEVWPPLRFSRDEVGVLERAFARMAHTIAEREASLRDATDRLQSVLDHMGQAILVFDARGALSAERSRQAEGLLHEPAPHIRDVLFPSGSVGEVEREAFDGWLDAVFAGSVERFHQLDEFAPRETRVAAEGGPRTYELAFRPLSHGDQVEQVMVLATDVTEDRSFRADAQRKDREHEKRVAAMRRLVAGGGQVFVRFLSNARYRVRASLDSVSEITASNRGAVAGIFRHVHTLRGEARCFDLDRVEAQLAEIEFELSDLRVRGDERYDAEAAKRSLRERLEQVAIEVESAEQLFVEQSPVGAAILDQVTVRGSDLAALSALAGSAREELAEVVARLSARPFGESVFVVTESIPEWASRAQKTVALDVHGRETPVPSGLARLLPGLLAHAVRNAIAHGIETPEERLTVGKPTGGTVTLRCEPIPEGVRVVVEDDGQGFDLAGLQTRTGASATQSDITELIGPGVSTRQAADSLAGYGVGLSAVRDELAAVGYRLRIESEPGRGARVMFEPAYHP